MRSPTPLLGLLLVTVSLTGCLAGRTVAPTISPVLSSPAPPPVSHAPQPLLVIPADAYDPVDLFIVPSPPLTMPLTILSPHAPLWIFGWTPVSSRHHWHTRHTRHPRPATRSHRPRHHTPRR